ncbi:MAG TPA: T9SS type A sorting domain-containing protein [Ginsengibacter sp.]|nr:T9SS type A sorting domain-containing protein [Ginsengibacter sp.]
MTTYFMTISAMVHAQARTYNLVYSDNIKGGTAIFGNTLLQVINSDTVNTLKMNDNKADGNSIYGNDNENMKNVDLDGSSGNGSVTINSSSADLTLPAGNNKIKLARLYWGGRIRNSDFDLTAYPNQSIKIRKDTSGAYSNITALGIDEITIVSGYSQYQAYADITDFVKNNGAGTYEVGNAPLSTGAIDNGGNNGGWCIVVVYENDAINYNSIRIYDGFQQVYNNGNLLSTSVTLTGLNVPSGQLESGDAKMGILAWEGDANLSGDYLKINGNLFSNTTNPVDNVWNGTITDNGVHVTSKSPNYTNQMGLDIDQFDIGTGYGILSNDSSVTLEFGTTADKYFPGLFTFTIKMKDPTINIDDTVSDANDNHFADVNEVLTYTLKGENSGTANANSVVITDTLPATVTYVPNSLKIISAPGIVPGTKTDAYADDIAEYITNGSTKTIQFRIGTGASNSAGGTIAPGENYEVQFKVAVNNPGAGKQIPPIMNIARIKALSDANVNFVDDGTAVINPDNVPEGGPLPVSMVSFTASLFQDKKVKLDWKTSMEINCRKYEIERSFDGNIFSNVAEVPGAGTTSSIHSYSYLDDISSVGCSIIYYRIDQIDNDGKSSYSKVLQVKINDEMRQLIISPNPFTSYISIKITWNKNENVTAKIINLQGSEVFTKNIQMNKGANYVPIDDVSDLPPGNYFIQFISATERFTKKITKQ